MLHGAWVGHMHSSTAIESTSASDYCSGRAGRMRASPTQARPTRLAGADDVAAQRRACERVEV